MYTTYHLKSADELTSDILDSIKATFKSKPITIIVEEDENEMDLSDEMKAILDERLLEGDAGFISSEESIKQLKKKYGV
jgi:hypothetical protein